MKKQKHFCLPIWRKRNVKAEMRGYFNAGEVRDAHHWDSCAMGEAATRYPKLLAGRIPRDEQLIEAGRQFYFAVANNGFSVVRRILDRIEKRLAKLDAAASTARRGRIL